MGTVYRGTQLNLGRDIAIKVLSPQLAADEQFIRRFRREAATLATLNHPHIVTIYDTGNETGLDYIVMAYVAGPDGESLSLRQVMNNGPLDKDFALRVIAQTCAALQYAHDKGIIHRDIKPENILLDAQGNVHIADFGIARAASGLEGSLTLTTPGAMIGTLKYMAPEQKVDAGHGDARSDLYALGVVFYEMLTGQVPEGRFELPSEVRRDLDRRTDRIVERALHRAAERRYQTAAEMARDLSTLTILRDAPPLPVPPQKTPIGRTKTSGFSPEVTEPLDRKVKHSPLWRYGTVAGLIGLILLVGGLWYRFRQPLEEAPQQLAVVQEAGSEKKAEEAQGPQGQAEVPPSPAKETPQPEAKPSTSVEDEPRKEAPPSQATETPQPETNPSVSIEEERRKEKEREQAEAAQRVAGLLDKAQKQKAAGRLTTPAKDNALVTYREVLRVAPGHEEALRSIQEIKEQYRQLADAAQQKGEWAKAQAHYETALKIDPQDTTLSAALQQVKEARKQAEAIAGWYETTVATPVLKEPRQDAPVLTQLSPQKRVYVAGAVGDYMRIESVRGNPPGYIARKNVTPSQEKPETPGTTQQATLEKPRTDTEQRSTVKEMSQEEARIKLQQMGVSYSVEAYEESVRKGDTKAVELFLAAGMNPNYKDTEGQTALIAAAVLGHAAIIQALIVNGADVNAKNKNGETALMGAAFRGQTNIVQMLIAKGANVNEARDKDGLTALMMAANAGQIATVQVLIANGADVNAKSHSGNTALIHAAHEGHTATVQALIANGADVNAKGKGLWGRTALRIAVRKGHTEIVHLLERAGASR
jgi:serine/threonine protein kinase/ankyrin repeat protein